jgi:hypothetical protein
VTPRQEPDDTQIAEWKASGHPYKLIAAHIAEWAKGKEHGTLLPGNEEFAGNLPIVAGPGPWKRAKALLAEHGIIYRNDGPYQVA